MSNFKTSTELVLRPFGTGTSCVDTIYGECKNDKSLTECIKECEDSPYCSLGLYVESKDKNYCMPFNTTNYYNRDPSLFRIYEKNNSQLSKKSRTTFFYDSRYWNPKTPYNTSFLFETEPITLSTDKLFMNSNLQFTPYYVPPFFLMYESLYSHQIRLQEDNYFFLRKQDSFDNLYYNTKKNIFEWQKYTVALDPNFLFYVEKSKPSSNQFVNNKEPIYIYMKFGNEKKYLTITKELFLALSSTKDTIFILSKIQEPLDKNLNLQNTHSMENYLQNTFSNNKKKPTYFIFCWFFLLIILQFYILILIKKYK